MNHDCIFDWSTYRPQERAVLCFLRRDRELLLIHKKRGLGAGKVNGPGGKTESGETLSETAIRETREEVGLSPEEPHHQGVLRFVFSDGYHLEVHVFTATRWSGKMIETDEARPFWTSEDTIPFQLMWEDDRHWLPGVLSGLSVDAEMYFDNDTMVCWDIRFSNGDRVHGAKLPA